MEAVIEAALNDWRTFNASGRWWATFEAIQFPYELVVRLEYGVIHTNGQKETAIQTVQYTMLKDGMIGIV